MRATLPLLVAFAAASPALADPPASYEPPYETSFRIIDVPPIQPHQSLEGWTGWHVPRGQATVDPFGGPNETPAVVLPPQSVARRSILASGEDIVWTVTRIRSAGGSTAPSDLPSRPLAAVVAFDSDGSLYALHGDGSGGGSPVALGVSLGGGATWRDIAIRHDYTHQRYDVYVDNSVRAWRLGFRDHVTEHHGLMQGSDDSEGRLSHVLVTTTTPPGNPYLLGDVNLSGRVRVSDLVRLIRGLHGATLSLQQRVNADMNEDGAVTEADRDALIDTMLGVTAP